MMKPGIIDAASAQRHIRIAKSLADGMTVTLAFELMSKAVGAMKQDLHPCGYYMDDLNTPKPIPNSTPVNEKPTPRCIVTEHREVAFTFSDGKKIQGCTATDCYWGKRNPNDRKTFVKKHSDGTPGGTLYSSAVLGDAVEDDEPEIEQTADDPAELRADGIIHSTIVETEDGIVPEPAVERDEDVVFGQTVDDAAEYDEDEYDD